MQMGAVLRADELRQLLQSQPDKNLLEARLSDIREAYSKNLSALIQNTEIISVVSEWLKSNINSPLSSSLLKFLIRLYELMGFSRNSDINEYYRCHERIFNKDPKFLSKGYLEGYDLGAKSKDALVDNPLLNFTALHITLTVIADISKSPEVKKFKPTILILTSLLSLYCYDSKPHLT